MVMVKTSTLTSLAKALLLVLAISLPLPGLAQECQRDGGAWHSCSFDSIDIGRQWELRLPDEHWQLSHDGSGTVKIREGSGEWITTQPQWAAPGVLCWGPLCARGALPLD